MSETKRGKEQVVLLVDSEVVTALDTLRIIAATSRARVTEPLLSDAVREALNSSPERVGEVLRVHRLAERAGMSVAEYVAAYARAYSRLTYGPGLEALEADDREVTGARTKPRPIAA